MSKTADKIINTNTAGTPVIDMTNLGNHVACPTCKDKDQHIADLEAKLAESEEKCEELKQSISKCTGELPPNVAFDIVNDDIRYQIVCNLIDRNNEHRNTIKQLKQQLAEKEKEIENFKFKLELRAMNLQEINMERVALEKQVKKHNQDKIELLEKVKENLFEGLYELYSKPCVIWEMYGDDYGDIVNGEINKIIDTLISEFKG